jgi:hypothetical protein
MTGATSQFTGWPTFPGLTTNLQRTVSSGTTGDLKSSSIPAVDLTVTDRIDPSSKARRPRWEGDLERRLTEILLQPSESSVSFAVLLQVSKEAPLLLPPEIPPPAVVPTEDGFVELEWRKSRIHLRLCFSGSNSYAWIDRPSGNGFVHGPMEMMGLEVIAALTEMKDVSQS